jgi:hypothetical protein
MSQQQLKLGFEPQSYQIRLIGEDGATRLVYETMCANDDEAIDIVTSIRDVPYARFEITQDGEMISKGARFD